MLNIDEMLYDELKGEFENLDGMELGSEEYKATVEGIAKLADRLIELKKFDAERDDMRHKKLLEEADRKLERARAEEEKKDQLIKNGIAIAGILIPTAVTIWGTFKTFKFEETGTVTTMMGRGFINKLLPKK